jgi:alkyl sulfatase BDS1-like metallo-beta-lactamase superfamily hydrolase
MLMTELPFGDRTDFRNAERGRIDALDPCVIRAADGRVVWDLTPYAYLDEERPDTVHPSLWRQAQLCVKQGLFEVTGGIYQIRGLDLSNMTLVEGDTGVIVIAPTRDITHTGQEETIDGVRIVFQLTPGTEAPAEMNFHFPAHRALCMAENATHNLHNLLTLRGALVRDPRVWSRYLNEAIELFSADTDVAFRRITGRPGTPGTSSGTCPSSVTCTPTCTTRRCAC